MRLLNTTTIELTEFVGEVPPYAILSHTWGDEEVTFQDMTCNKQAAARKKGYYSKILGACDQARVEDGLEWVWVDTCCIDKSSSAELSEAINSMFQWYNKARVCYAYLSDVQNETQFTFSRWFTRGWTLQELLAPREIEFYSSTWEFIGTKFGLADSIAHVSGVESTYLRGEPFFAASVAQRMSWASRRKTTREEDIAYCLLGVFGVNMSLIYGEGGTKAFVRLQEEIMRNCNDQSILAWAWGSTTSEPGTTSVVPGTMF
ncbi:HET-domain-containing protein [Coniochaeta sp. PMI_546]|nr:HET-domain-containing protein [Coniochaeta sp. PMI_546]